MQFCQEKIILSRKALRALPEIILINLLKKCATLSGILVRPEKWGHSQVGFRSSNASGGHIVLLPSAFWAHGASKMSTLSASLPLRILQYFRA